MLKKICVDQVVLGMHLHSLCGPWLDHPFWKTKFVLRDPEDLAKLRASSVLECEIDTEKGLDVGEAQPASVEAPVRADAPGRAEAAARVEAQCKAASVATAASVADAPAAPLRTTLEEESELAARLCNQARETVGALFGDARMGRALQVESCIPIVKEISASVRRNATALIGLVRLKAHDDYTFMHSVAVCTLMVALAQKMGHGEEAVREAGLAGMLHDIGKSKIPLAVLSKPGKLTDAEFALMKQHSRFGHELLLAGGSSSAIALDVCLHHHERPDGKGYPGKLEGAALSLQARMGSICDVYDAITSNRTYRGAWGPAEAIAKMAEWTKAGQFDPLVFRSFIDCIGIYPVGSLVRLQSGRLAVTVEQGEKSLATPCVKVFYSTRSNMPVPIEVIDLGRPGCHERIIGRESNSQWRFQFLDDLSVGATPLHARPDGGQLRG